jgi:CDP-glucose 4,6-dehydratase
MKSSVNRSFWQGKRVFLTGHTGFKGSWASLWLKDMGAELFGYSLPPETDPSLYQAAEIEKLFTKVWYEDIREPAKLEKALTESRADIVFHFAAQPLVRLSYDNPVETFDTNVMGTLHLLQGVRKTPSAKAIVIVTSDKCYENLEVERGYRENDPMGGYDPYSASKGCAEIVTASMRRSFFNPGSSQTTQFIASARAGNVIGGGDWSKDRLIPDSVRSWSSGKPVIIRNPQSVRPWQHVLEPVSGYFQLAEKLFAEGAPWAEAWNFGPEGNDQQTVRFVLDRMRASWGESAAWEQDKTAQPHEAKLLYLDVEKSKQKLGWKPVWDIDRAIQYTCQWYVDFYKNKTSAKNLCLEQIRGFENAKPGK